MNRFAKILSTTAASAVLATTALVSGASAGRLDNAGAFDAERFLLRGRLIAVTPDEDSSTTIGGEIEADTSVVPEFDISYFFTDNIAAELILATSNHDLSAKNTALGNLDLGDAWALPPTVTLQYHFTPDAIFRPYVGAGINYTIMYGEDEAAGINKLEVDNNVGWALQAGFDYALNEHWALNADVKKLWLNVDASVNSGAVRADVDLDPWIFGLGVAYRF